jgi:hypothetical protein
MKADESILIQIADKNLVAFEVTTNVVMKSTHNFLGTATVRNQMIMRVKSMNEV